MAPSYAAVLRAPHAFRTFSLALVGRLSYGTVFLSLTLAFSASTGSYARAGALMALNGLTVSVLSPLRAGLIDRHGPRRTLPPMAAGYCLALLALAALTWRPGAPLPLLTALTLAAGATMPPLGVVMRTLWNTLLPDGPLLRRAYSLDTVCEELVFVTGPLLAGLLAAAAQPALGIALSAALIAVGTLGLVTSPAVRPRRHAARHGRRRPAIPLAPCLAAASTGVVLGSTALLAVAFTRQHHQPAAVAWIEAALAAGSAAGGLAYGALSRTPPGRGRLALLLLPLGAALAAAGLALSTLALTAVACVAGLFISPVLTAAYLLADATAPPDARTRAAAWVNTALNLGAAGGTAVTGVYLDALPLPLCYVLAAAPALAAAALLPLLRERQSDSPEPAAIAHHRPMDDTTTGQEFWDSRYAESDRIWSGNPNTVLVREVADLAPGTALDLGCGEGADAIWLARRGWRVTAVDVSGVAVERAARHARDEGVADRVDFQRRDLAESFPEGEFDLVSAQFLHSPTTMPRERVLRAAAAAVAPGGVLLVVGHAGPPPWDPDAHPEVHLPTPDEVLASLELPDGAWEVLLSGEHERVQTAPDGRTMTRTDNALKIRRLPG
ncbi:MFS transporter [Actinomadura geliboluensis]|uniref:MFS transporter n=1 Tax=Actinomadura geliboluensis TaxID=882440 RepID=UPI0036A400EB